MSSDNNHEWDISKEDIEPGTAHATDYNCACYINEDLDFESRSEWGDNEKSKQLILPSCLLNDKERVSQMLSVSRAKAAILFKAPKAEILNTERIVKNNAYSICCLEL